MAGSGTMADGVGFLFLQAAIKDHLPASVSMTADLGDDYTFPRHITPTDLRPDIVLWDDSKKSLTLLELTVCFETQFRNAQMRKEERYRDLIKEAELAGGRLHTK